MEVCEAVGIEGTIITVVTLNKKVEKEPKLRSSAELVELPKPFSD